MKDNEFYPGVTYDERNMVPSLRIPVESCRQILSDAAILCGTIKDDMLVYEGFENMAVVCREIMDKGWYPKSVKDKKYFEQEINSIVQDQHPRYWSTWRNKRMSVKHQITMDRIERISSNTLGGQMLATLASKGSSSSSIGERVKQAFAMIDNDEQFDTADQIFKSITGFHLLSFLAVIE